MSPERRRVLFVVPPFTGHVNPAAAVARRLQAGGHEVAWVAQSAMLDNSTGDQVFSTAFPCPFQPPERPARLRGFAALKYLWHDVLIPMADAMAPMVEQAITEFAPDVVLADQQAFAGALVAERLGVPWATSATTSSELTDPLADQPRITEWQQGLLRELRARIGDPGGSQDPRFSPTLVLLFSTESLTGPLALGSAALACVGPALPVAAPVGPPDADGPVLVTLGTINSVNSPAAERFFDVCEQAFADGPGAVIVDPSCGQTRRRGAVTRVAHIDQLDVLRRSSAVICHGGHNTVCESLWHGLPLVVAPIRDDQPLVADQVVRAGAGVRVRFDRVDAEQLAAARVEVSSAAHRLAAARIGASFRVAGGAKRAAELLVQV